MPQQIRTKWHKIIPLIEQDEVYLTAPQKGTAAHWADHNPNVPLVKTFIDQLGALPKYVINDELLAFTTKQKFQQSLLDMKEAGVLRLPFPAMIVEFNAGHDPDRGCRVIVMLRDNRADERMAWEPRNDPPLATGPRLRDKDFYGFILRVEQEQGKDYLVMAPGVHALDIVRGEDGLAWLRIWADHHSLLKETPQLNKLLGDTYVKDVSTLWKALSCALLLMNTEGVEKEIIDTTKVNRTRGGKSGKPTIPTHTYLHLGHVYKNNTSTERTAYVPGQKRLWTPHWRRGYLQPVRFGKGWSQKRFDYINPRFIEGSDFEGDIPPPPSKEYLVRR